MDGEKGGPGVASRSPLRFFLTALTEFICRIKVHLAAERLFSGGHIWRSCEGVCLKKGVRRERGWVGGGGGGLPCSVHLIVLTSHTLLSPQSCHAYPGSLISKEHHSFLQLEEKWWRWWGGGCRGRGATFSKLMGQCNS